MRLILVKWLLEWRSELLPRLIGVLHERVWRRHVILGLCLGVFHEGIAKIVWLHRLLETVWSLIVCEWVWLWLVLESVTYILRLSSLVIEEWIRLGLWRLGETILEWIALVALGLSKWGRTWLWMWTRLSIRSKLEWHVFWCEGISLLIHRRIRRVIGEGRLLCNLFHAVFVAWIVHERRLNRLISVLQERAGFYFNITFEEWIGTNRFLFSLWRKIRLISRNYFNFLFRLRIDNGQLICHLLKIFFLFCVVSLILIIKRFLANFFWYRENIFLILFDVLCWFILDFFVFFFLWLTCKRKR